jgi:hypothetical protein
LVHALCRARLWSLPNSSEKVLLTSAHGYHSPSSCYNHSCSDTRESFERVSPVVTMEVSSTTVDILMLFWGGVK